MLFKLSSPWWTASLLAAALPAAPALSDSRTSTPAISAPASYADLADLADGAPIVVRAQVRKLVPVEAARGVRAGWARYYIEARTEALITGTAPLGADLRYLADLPLDAKGKAPALKKRSVVLFARTVAGRPGELQLVAPDAQLVWDSGLDTRLKGLLSELLRPDAPPRITALREAVHVPGDAAGDSETQIFLTSASGEPAALSVTRRAGSAPRWGASFSELVASDSAPPAGTLGWYRLACFLPAQLPGGANQGETLALRDAAARDYAFVRASLGACTRTRS